MEEIEEKRSLRKRLVWCPVVLWMALIFAFSAQPADESAALSDGIVEVIVDKVISNFDQLTPGEQEALSSQWSFIVRKTAHAFVYTVLGVLTAFALSQTKTNGKCQMITAMSICFIYAMSDEFHQLFVPGRSGEIRDVLIDSTGAFLGILFFTLLSKRKGSIN